MRITMLMKKFMKGPKKHVIEAQGLFSESMNKYEGWEQDNVQVMQNDLFNLQNSSISILVTNRKGVWSARLA